MTNFQVFFCIPLCRVSNFYVTSRIPTYTHAHTYSKKRTGRIMNHSSRVEELRRVATPARWSMMITNFQENSSRETSQQPRAPLSYSLFRSVLFSLTIRLFLSLPSKTDPGNPPPRPLSRDSTRENESSMTFARCPWHQGGCLRAGDQVELKTIYIVSRNRITNYVY